MASEARKSSDAGASTFSQTYEEKTKQNFTFLLRNLTRPPHFCIARFRIHFKKCEVRSLNSNPGLYCRS